MLRSPAQGTPARRWARITSHFGNQWCLYSGKPEGCGKISLHFRKTHTNSVWVLVQRQQLEKCLVIQEGSSLINFRGVLEEQRSDRNLLQGWKHWQVPFPLHIPPLFFFFSFPILLSLSCPGAEKSHLWHSLWIKTTARTPPCPSLEDQPCPACPALTGPSNWLLSCPTRQLRPAAGHSQSGSHSRKVFSPIL